MKTYRHTTAVNTTAVVANQRTPLFSNHGSLATSIASKYTGGNRFTTSSRSHQRSKSRSPSNLRSPPESKHVPLYKRHAKANITRTKTPNMTQVETFEKRSSFWGNERTSRARKDRETIRNKTRDFQTKPSGHKVSSPHRSQEKSPKRSKSPKQEKIEPEVQSPFFNTKSVKTCAKKVEIAQPWFGPPQDDETEEEPRSLKVYKINSKS